MAGGMELEVETRVMRLSYNKTITSSEDEKVKKNTTEYSFELCANSKLLTARHLTSGVIGASAACLTMFFLKMKWGLLSEFVGRGSAIYKVSYPSARSAIFKKLISSGALESTLKKMFENLEESLEEFGCQELIAGLSDNKEFAAVKELRLKSLVILDTESVEKLLASRPWLASDETALKSRYGTGSVSRSTDDDACGAKRFIEVETVSAQADLEHDLWNTDVAKELRKIYPSRFTDTKLNSLLNKFDEIGVTEANDMKYFKRKEITKLLKEVLKPIEVLKLMDYASGACGAVSSIENLIQGMIDERLSHLRGSGELCYMGMQSRLIPNSAITASSFWGPQHEPYQARLDNSIVSGVSTGSWSSATNTVGQWLQVDFGSVKPVAGIITQSRPTCINRQWIRSFKIACGTDQQSLTVVKEDGRDKVFIGNSNLETKVYNRFPHVLHCRYIRVCPQTWNNHMSMRTEFVHGACFNYPHLP